MTTNDLDAIRSMVPAVYEGPWYVQLREEDGRWLVGYPTDNPKAGLIATVPDYGEHLAEFIAAARTLIPALCDEIEHRRAQLAEPCGSCHPCMNYADETWRRANRKPPHVSQWDEVQEEMKALRPLAAAAVGWRRFIGDDEVQFSEVTALIAAVDALPNLQEPCCYGNGCHGCPDCRDDA